MRGRIGLVLILLLAVVAVARVVGDGGDGGGPPPVNEPSSARLGSLEVAAEHSRDGYERTLFQHWIDADGDSCNTRCEVLVAEELPGGGWLSKFDGVRTIFSSDLDIDHLVPLAEAWDSGAWNWDDASRRDYANDLDEPAALQAVTSSTNRSKGDRDPAGWRPPDQSSWCAYATDWITVKEKWSLTIDEAERLALADMLNRC